MSKLATALPLSLILQLALLPPARAQDRSTDDRSTMTNATTMLLARVDASALPFDDIAEALQGQTIHVALDLPFAMTQPALRIYCRQEAPQLAEVLRRYAGQADVGDGQRQDRWWRYDVSLGAELDRDNVVGGDVLDGDRPELRSALDQAGQRPIAVAVALPEYFTGIFTRLTPTLPESLGGGESQVLLGDVRWAAIGIDPQAGTMSVDVQTASSEAARALAAQFPGVLAGAVSMISPGDQLPPLVEAIQLQADGDRVRWEPEPQVLGQLVGGIVSGATELQARGQQMVRLKRLALAIHNYHDRQQSFPPGKDERDEDGQPRLSWRVHILPYLDQEQLYRQFRLDQPWDSEHNRGLIERMPEIYAWPGLEPGKTVVQAPVGEGTIFGQDRPVTFRDVIDGTSNTAMLVYTQADRAVTWTAPDDYGFDPEQPQAGLMQDSEGLAAVAAADGSAHRVAIDRPTKTWLHLFQMNDRTPVQW